MLYYIEPTWLSKLTLVNIEGIYYEYDEILDIYGSMSDFICYSFNRGYYILRRLNEYNVPDREAYHVRTYEHDNLFFGYNESSSQMLGYNIKIMSSEMPISSLEKCCFMNRKFSDINSF